MKIDFWNKFKEKKFVRIVKIITGSATFALFLSIIFFAWSMYNSMKDSKEMTDNLMHIQSSLSTRYLGEFPNFLPNINELYTGVTIEDSIVIMEDVLFYGITSDPEQFYNTNYKLLSLANNGVPVMIVYYKPNSMTYNMTINEWLLSPECYKAYRDTLALFGKRSMQYKERKKALIDSCYVNNISKEETDRKICILMETYFSDIIDKKYLDEQKKRKLGQFSDTKKNPESTSSSNRDDYEQVRSILLEKYFSKTRESDRESFRTSVINRRRPTMQSVTADATNRTQIEVQQMCKKMDDVRTKYLGKEDDPIDNITFADFKKMYTEMTMIMEETYCRYPTITLVPVDEFLSVRSWFVQSKRSGNKAIMAFPSRYSSSEIGFFTTDNTTTNYIISMKIGILANYTD